MHKHMDVKRVQFALVATVEELKHENEVHVVKIS